MFFERGENDVVRRIEQRIARLLNWPVEKGEGMQVLQYRVGAQYLPHYDYFDPKEPASQRALLRGGNRVGTVVMYLNDTPRGGATLFPGLALAVSPKRGNAVFFAYPQADPSSGSLHGGAQVIEGEKWIATKWLREREFV
jgi:prolyl 4-hydroxylase